MNVEKKPSDPLTKTLSSFGQNLRDIAQAQQRIYDFLLTIVKTWPPLDALAEFKRLFIQNREISNPEILPALYVVIFANSEQEFRNTIKRACYIFINNWEVAREHTFIQQLVDLFQDPLLHRKTVSPTLRRLRRWLINFIESQDYRDLELFAARLNEAPKLGSWTKRYTSYLLVPQYLDSDNPIEQREAARMLSQHLKRQFKFDLAMYTARSESLSTHSPSHTNPTELGEEALRLVKRVVAKRGPFDYKQLAHLFLQQVRQIHYESFKLSLGEYLFFSIQTDSFAKNCKKRVMDYLDPLYQEHNQEEATSSLILRTCNRVIDLLTTENQQDPSALFSLFLSRGNSLTLTILLLKLVLISRKSQLYLEARIADLIRYYESFPKDECQWVIQFLEVFSVTFAIFTENVSYNLVRLETNGKTSTQMESETIYRVFSQEIKYTAPPDDPPASGEAHPQQPPTDNQGATEDWLDSLPEENLSN